MAGRPDCVVLTVFTANPPRGQRRTSYDLNCGFDTGRQAMGVRRQEDRAALNLLAAVGRHLGFMDHQYSPNDRPPLAELGDAIGQAVTDLAPERVLFPVGLGHPDHLMVAAACRVLAAMWSGVTPFFAYEELPYRVLFPEQVPAALGRLKAGDAPEFIGTGPLESKETAVGCYASQLWALDRHAVLCPERFWRIPCA